MRRVVLAARAYSQGSTGKVVGALLIASCLLVVVVSRADAATVRVATSGDGTGVVRIEAANVPSTFSPYWGDCPPYQVNGSRPNLPRGTNEQHAAWVEQQIRDASYVGR